jgi:hypothetical protein
MGDRAQVCRVRALECEHAAARAHDVAVRRAYLDLARQWRETAEQAKVLEHHPTMPKLLREEINDAMVRYLERRLKTGSDVDVAAMTREMAQSFVDMVMDQDKQIQPLLLAQMIAAMGDEYLQRRGGVPDGRRDH